MLAGTWAALDASPSGIMRTQVRGAMPSGGADMIPERPHNGGKCVVPCGGSTGGRIARAWQKSTHPAWRVTFRRFRPR